MDPLLPNAAQRQAEERKEVEDILMGEWAASRERAYVLPRVQNNS